MSYSPDQPRASDGKWTAGAGRQPITAHNSQPSVGVRLSAAARDAVIRGKGIDVRHYPERGAANLSKSRDLGMREPPNAADFAMSALRRRH
jgi:hypothetical protein